jgi:hypothetical protein
MCVAHGKCPPYLLNKYMSDRPPLPPFVNEVLFSLGSGWGTKVDTMCFGYLVAKLILSPGHLPFPQEPQAAFPSLGFSFTSLLRNTEA